MVHGGAAYPHAVVVDQDLLDHVESPSGLAPFHNPVAAELVRATCRVLPDTEAVACFDTTYFQDLPESAATYAVPRAWAERWPVRRFGAHGLSHAYAARCAARLVGAPLADLRVLTCHLGSGSSLAAVRAGRPVDTTMGMTPPEGLVMSTRSGTVDPGMLLWLMSGPGAGRRRPAAPVRAAGPVRDRRPARGHGSTGVTAGGGARLRRLPPPAASGGRRDGRRGAGRQKAVDGLAHLGLAIDPERNQRFTGDGDVSLEGASARTVVLRSNEDLEIAAQVERLLEGTHPL